MSAKNQTTHSRKFKEINREIRADFRKDFAQDLSVGASFSDLFAYKMPVIRMIRRGLPYFIFEQIKDLELFSDDQWADFLQLSPKTLKRNSERLGFRFNSLHSEKIMQLAEVIYFGLQVFDSSEVFAAWLNTKNIALGFVEPVELLKDAYGKELIMSELNRIEYGIFA